MRTGKPAAVPARATAVITRPTSRPVRAAPEILVIGASTGGPNALADMCGALRSNLGVPVLIVQHMPPLFTQLLAERLTAKGPLRFREASDGEVLQAGDCLIAPGDYHMRVERSGVHKQVRMRLEQTPPENSCRPAVDVLFRSVAEVYGGHALAVVLTGMGQDGLKGVEKLHAMGAQTVVQDEATSVVWGMPGFIARAGLADGVLPLPDLAPEVLRRLHPQTADAAIGGSQPWK